MSVVKRREGETFSSSVEMVTITCYKCGVLFAVTRGFDNERHAEGKNGKGFWCPNGHNQVYCESTEARLKRELQQAKANAQYYERQAETERNEAQYLRRSRDAYRGQVTKIKRRVSNGVCPCCNRTFQNLARHMESQHPEWKEGSE